MNNWIAVERIERVLDINHFIFLWVLLPCAYFFYRSLLKRISEKRHNNLKRRFKITTLLLAVNTLLAALIWRKTLIFPGNAAVEIALSYIALICLIGSALTVIRFAQIFIYLYLFFRNMAQGVPRLIANLFTIVFSLLVMGLIASFVFDFHFSTLLTTSAIFSVVLGLALQDTLGNLFSGLTFQLDQPFKIGDWIEIQSDSQKWLGQIHEITWRATYIMSFSNELVMIPNKIISQSKVILYSHASNQVRFNHTYRFSLETDVTKAKDVLYKATLETPGVMNDPAPRPLLIETTESFMIVKIFYSVEDVGMRYRVGDQVMTESLRALKTADIQLAVPKLMIANKSEIRNVNS